MRKGGRGSEGGSEGGRRKECTLYVCKRCVCIGKKVVVEGGASLASLNVCLHMRNAQNERICDCCIHVRLLQICYCNCL